MAAGLKRTLTVSRPGFRRPLRWKAGSGWFYKITEGQHLQVDDDTNDLTILAAGSWTKIKVTEVR